ncbi:PaaI family thioesterase [candidate division KSB1 bacterium]|nr:PaaI family thioesterase [candidate division KSB1 bacterium]
MQNIAQYFNNHDQFAKYTGMELVSVSAGRAKAKLIVKDIHLNSARVVHGGVIFTLADFAFAAASNSDGKMALSINASINFLKAAQGGSLYAEAKQVSLHPKIGTYSIQVTDEDHNLIATFQGIVYRKNVDLPEWDS